MTAKRHHQDPNLTVITHKDAYQQQVQTLLCTTVNLSALHLPSCHQTLTKDKQLLESLWHPVNQSYK